MKTCVRQFKEYSVRQMLFSDIYQKYVESCYIEMTAEILQRVKKECEAQQREINVTVSVVWK